MHAHPRTSVTPRGTLRGAKGLLLLLALPFAACGEGAAPAEELSREGSATAEELADRRLVPGERAGILTAELSEAELLEKVGERRLRSTEIPIGEGFCLQGSALFPGTPDELTITWRDANRSAPAVIRITRAGAWATAEGLRIGATLDDLVAANGGPLVFSGFGWDYGGRVMDWLGGSLDAWAGESESARALTVILEADVFTGEPPSAAAARDLLGDLPVRSDAPALKELNVRIVMLELGFAEESSEPVECRGPDGIEGDSTPGAEDDFRTGVVIGARVPAADRVGPRGAMEVRSVRASARS